MIRPKLVILQLGVNDLKSLGLISDYERVVERSFTNTPQIAKTFANADKEVLALMVFPTGDISIPRMLIWSDKIEKGINKYNLNRATINEPNVLIVNVDHFFDKNLSLHKDALHLNGLGYERLNTHIAPTIAELLELE